METRLIERVGTGDDDYLLGSFIWFEDGSDALFEPRGRRDVLGTEHDVPAQQQCLDCHQGEPGRVIGFSAIQLARATPLDLSAVSDMDMLAPTLSSSDIAAPPGDAVTRAAFGYMHANCGTCHAQGGSAFEDVAIVLRLRASDAEPAKTELFNTTVGVALERFDLPPFTDRVVPGDADASALHFRMSVRTLGMEQMPSIGTELVDLAGLDAVRAWIESLPPK